MTECMFADGAPFSLTISFAHVKNVWQTSVVSFTPSIPDKNLPAEGDRRSSEGRVDLLLSNGDIKKMTIKKMTIKKMAIKKMAIKKTIK